MRSLTRLSKLGIFVFILAAGLAFGSQVSAFYYLNPFTKKLDFFNFAGNGVANQITFFSATNTLDGDTGLTYNTSTQTLTVQNLFVTSCTGCGGGGGGSGSEWSDNGVNIYNTTPTRGVIGWTNFRSPQFMATSTGIGFAASGTIAIAGTASSTFAGPVSTTKIQVDGTITANGDLLVQKASANIRLCEPGGATCFNILNDGGAALRIGGASYTGIRIRDLIVEVFGNLNPLTNNFSDLGTPTVAYRNIYASGTADIFGGKFVNVTSTQATTTFFNVGTTARLPTDTLINSTTVCLSNGTNCPASGGGTITSSTWQYNLTNATIFPTTSTFDVLIGGNTTATAGIVLDGAGTSTFANRVSSTGFIAGIGTQTAPSYGFTGYGGGLWSGGADLRIVTNDLIIRNIANTVTAFRVAGGLATFSVIPTPASHNAYDIGFVNTAWKNIYASGTLFAVGGQFSLVTSTQATTTWLNVGTTARLPADSLINGTTVCLSNGTNCPAGGSQDLQSVTGFGATTTDRIYPQGGIETPSIGINTDDTSVYELNVNGEANFDALVRMSNDLNVVDASENPIFVVRPLAGTPAVGILTEPSELGEALAVLGTVSSSDMIVLNDVVVGGQSVCLENGTNCPTSGGAQTLAQVTALGASATATLSLLGGYVAASSTVTSTFTVLGTTALLGNVGVGTANPEGKLHVSGAVNERLVLDNGMIISQKNASGVIRNIFTLYSDNNVYFDSLDGGMFLRVGAGLNKGITVLNGGNVGIGTLAPSVALDVNGSVSSTNILTGAIYARTNNIFNIGSPTSSFANIYASGTAVIGNVTTTQLAFTSASGSSLLISGQSVCLANGTNCPVASLTVAGLVEIADSSETSAGTDATRAVSPDGLSQSIFGTKIVELYVTTSSGAFLAVNSASNTSTCFLIPSALNGMNLTAVQGQHGVAGAAGTSTQIQVRNYTDNADMLTVPIHIDPGERNSSDASTQPVINTATDDVATFDRVCADVDAVETTPGKETIVSMTFSLP